jgi:rhodanese-related sulfurtransferase/DNA-binding transcriptional ArsR family regulator
MNDDGATLTARAFKDAVYEQFARITKALASPVRLEIVDVLAQGERTVDALAREVGQSLANTSQHLRSLHAARLVEARRDGTFAHYRLADPQVIEVWRAVRALGERQLAEIERTVAAYLGDADGFESVTADDLQRRLADGEVVLLDVRPDAEYRAGHLPVARSIPVGELADRLAELPADATVVAYCRGPYCVMSYDALTILRDHGRRGVRLAEGLPDWRAAGRPVQGGHERG